MADKLTNWDHRYSTTPRQGSRAVGPLIDNGFDTARTTKPATPEEARVRAERDAAALSYLDRTGRHDIAVILGLAPLSPAKTARRVDVTRTVQPVKTCEICGGSFRPASSHYATRTCSKSCGRKLGARTKRETAPKEDR